MNNILSNEKGFTLIELLVVLIILTMLATIVGPRLIGVGDKAKRDAAKIQIKNLEGALKMFRLDNGYYPDTDQGLEALLHAPEGAKSFREGGYLESNKVPLDPWKNPYIYVSPGNYNPDYDLMSLGADNAVGGEGKDADIKSWELDE